MPQEETVRARLMVEVTAGLVPGQAMDEHRRVFALTEPQWSRATDSGTQSEALADVNGRAQAYAGLLMLQPDRVNWVNTHWLWL
jgi:hypothetical protein